MGSLRRGVNRCVELGVLSKFQQVVVQGLMACYQQYENCLGVEQDGGGVKGGGRGFLGDRNLGNRTELLVHVIIFLQITFGRDVVHLTFLFTV